MSGPSPSDNGPILTNHHVAFGAASTSADYSRSIGVDIRYVLWVTEKFAGAGFLLEEMGAGTGK